MEGSMLGAVLSTLQTLCREFLALTLGEEILSWFHHLEAMRGLVNSARMGSPSPLIPLWSQTLGKALSDTKLGQFTLGSFGGSEMGCLLWILTGCKLVLFAGGGVRSFRIPGQS